MPKLTPKFKEGLAEFRADLADIKAAKQEARKDPDNKRRRLSRIGGAIMAFAGMYAASRHGGVDSAAIHSAVEHVVAPTAQAAKFAWGAGRFETQFRARALAPLSVETALNPGDRELRRRRRAAAVLIAATGVLHPIATATPAMAETTPIVHQVEDKHVQAIHPQAELQEEPRAYRVAESGDSVEGWAAHMVDKENGANKITDWQVHKVADSIIDANPAIQNDPQHWLDEDKRYDITAAEQVAEEVAKPRKSDS